MVYLKVINPLTLIKIGSVTDDFQGKSEIFEIAIF